MSMMKKQVSWGKKSKQDSLLNYHFFEKWKYAIPELFLLRFLISGNYKQGKEMLKM